MSSPASETFLSGKRVLVTGAAGSIGSALCRRLVQKNLKKLWMLDQDETGIFDVYEELKSKGADYIIGNIRERERVEEIFKEGFDVVFHAAAYKHVSLMDRYPQEAVKTNVYGTLNLLGAAEKAGVQKFIFISSDKAVNPKCEMGYTKAMAEEHCHQKRGDMKGIVVRFGNVMPSRGSVVPIFNRLIAEGKNLTVTSPEMKRYFMGIYDAVELVLKAAERGEGGETFILDMGEEVYIKDLAKMMIKLSGKDLGIDYTNPNEGEKYTEELITEEEKGRATLEDGMYVIRN